LVGLGRRGRQEGQPRREIGFAICHDDAREEGQLGGEVIVGIWQIPMNEMHELAPDIV